MSSSPGIGFWYLVASMGASMYGIWRKGPYVPRATRGQQAPETPAPAVRSRTPGEAFMNARRAEYVRLASSIHYVRVPHLSGPPTAEKLILSMPVFLYESRENRLKRKMSHVAINRSKDLVHAHPTGSAKRETLALVDHGTLLITHRRILFTSSRRLREFPFGELTFFSTDGFSIALAARWRFGISYFRGINASKLIFKSEPECDEQWHVQEYRFSMTGRDIREIVEILQAAPVLQRT